MAQVSGSLITREYRDFRGVDFTDREVSLYRSPDSLNMYKNYKNLGKSIETRPEIELVATYDNTIFGLFFYRVGNTEMMIVHSGTKLYRVEGDTKTELFTGMKPARSNAFVYNQILYIKDGINYLKYDGETISQVTGYIPITSIGRKPAGGGTVYQDINMLSAWRKNTFLGDGESTEYYLDAQNIDSDTPLVSVNGEATTEYTVDTTRGMIKFNVAPPKPLTDGQDNVSITFKKTVTGYADRINKCTLLQVFDNRVFFSGNQDYPNTVWHCSLNDPTYCSDLDYYNEGLDLSPVKSMVAGNNALWVFKEPSQANTTVFYHNPVVDSVYGKIYPSTHSNISTGCVAAGINFNDDIAFFSDRGMEAINGDITTEQVVAHRSTMIDSKLLNEPNYKNMILEEWEGYLLVIIDNKVYLADSRAMVVNQDHNEYEWFYWELEKNITCTKVKDGVLYLGTDKGIYALGIEKEGYTEVTFTKENDEYVLYGESTQATRSGKNLLNANESYTFPANENNYLGGNSYGGIEINLIENTKYYVSYNITASSTSTRNTPMLISKTVVTNYFEMVGLNYNSQAGRKVWEFTAPKTDTYFFNYWCNVPDVDVVLSDIMISTSSDTIYEPYGTMPSPEFPSEIVNKYKAGKYKTTIDGREYRFILDDDLRSIGEVKDRVYLSNDKLYLEKKVETRTLNGTEYWMPNGTIVDGYYTWHVSNGVIRTKGNTCVLSNKFLGDVTWVSGGETIQREQLSSAPSVLTLRLSQSRGVEHTTSAIMNWLSTNNVTVYCESETQTTNEINYLISPISYWVTTDDEFNYPQYQKTTNKRGCVIDMEGEEVTVSTKIDNGDFEVIDTYENVKGYVVSRIKKKKWKSIQLKFSSNKPFSLYSSTLEAYVGGYVKR